MDPPVAPDGVLLGESEDEGDGARGDRWPARAAMRVGPPPADEIPVPAKQRVGLDEEVSASVPGEQPCQPGEQCPVRRTQRWPVDLATQHRHLVAQHDHLDRQFVSAPTCEPDQLGNADEQEVEERQGHGAILVADAPELKVLVVPPDGILGTHTPDNRRRRQRERVLVGPEYWHPTRWRPLLASANARVEHPHPQQLRTSLLLFRGRPGTG